jgi:hypothetical protein
MTNDHFSMTGGEQAQAGAASSCDLVIGHWSLRHWALDFSHAL